MQKYSGNTDKILYIPDSLALDIDEESSSHSDYFSARGNSPLYTMKKTLKEVGEKEI